MFKNILQSRYCTSLRNGLVIVAAVSALSACQVRPLLGTQSPTRNQLPSISISAADTRLEQVVRNELAFLTGGSKENMDQALNYTYELTLNVTGSSAGILGTGSDNLFSAGRMTVNGIYNLKNMVDETIIIEGSRSAVAQYDLPDQEYAKIRALRDAENRAGRELAAQIYADLAAAFNK